MCSLFGSTRNFAGSIFKQLLLYACVRMHETTRERSTPILTEFHIGQFYEELSSYVSVHLHREILTAALHVYTKKNIQLFQQKLQQFRKTKTLNWLRAALKSNFLFYQFSALEQCVFETHIKQVRPIYVYNFLWVYVITVHTKALVLSVHSFSTYIMLTSHCDCNFAVIWKAWMLGCHL